MWKRFWLEDEEEALPPPCSSRFLTSKTLLKYNTLSACRSALRSLGLGSQRDCSGSGPVCSSAGPASGLHQPGRSPRSGHRGSSPGPGTGDRKRASGTSLLSVSAPHVSPATPQGHVEACLLVAEGATVGRWESGGRLSLGCTALRLPSAERGCLPRTQRLPWLKTSSI